jgi:poly-gamma-glutamate capsule biosynthesis protein CapA/YwtB (metallophosphatase superfamily)
MKDQTSLVFTGDIGFDKYMAGKWDDPDLLSKEVLDYLHSGDHVIANVEGALVEPQKQETQGTAQLVHSMNPAAGKVLDAMHADIWNLCNNHIKDAGDAGVAETLRQAELHHARTIGAGRNLDEASRPLYLEEAGGIGMFAVGFRRGCKPAGEHTAGTLLWNETERIRKIIQEIKSRCRWCILVVHGGEEFTSLPSPYVRKRYLSFLDMGADIIVSHHPHVPMNYERVGKKIIFYSLGNFIFDTDYQRAQFHTDQGILVRLSLNEQTYTWDAMGLRIDRTNEHVKKAELPGNFTDVQEDEYRLLAPLAAKQMVNAYMRRQIYLDPERWKNASAEEWKEHFSDPKRSGRVPGEALDFLLVCPLAEQADQREWKKSKLESVKKYILDQLR